MEKICQKRLQNIIHEKEKKPKPCLGAENLYEELSKRGYLESKGQYIDVLVASVWEMILSNFASFRKVPSGRKKGIYHADLINHERKIIVELKNRYNTLNACGRRGVFDKLLDYKKKYPDYCLILCAY
ncbi:Eco47II family restriction endonuclease [bacterium]|nr:Eco47II family restriction endonuclease [bacterium]